MQIGDICLHLHHEVLAEMLTQPVENRISYILSDKPVAEQALRLRMMGPPIIDDQMHADAAWLKAEAEWHKAYAAWRKADAAWLKAEAAWHKVDAAWLKADTAWQKVDTAWQKAGADLQKAYAEWQKACAVWLKAYEPHYRRLYPESPWDGRTILPAGQVRYERF
jgi:hypothetical protein